MELSKDQITGSIIIGLGVLSFVLRHWNTDYVLKYNKKIKLGTQNRKAVEGAGIGFSLLLVVFGILKFTGVLSK